MNYAASRYGNKIIRRNENTRYVSGENMAFIRARALQKRAQRWHALRVANNTQMVYCQDFSMIIMLFSWKFWESCTKRSDNNIEFRNLDDKNTVFVEKKVLATLHALPRHAAPWWRVEIGLEEKRGWGWQNWKWRNIDLGCLANKTKSSSGVLVLGRRMENTLDVGTWQHHCIKKPRWDMPRGLHYQVKSHSSLDGIFTPKGWAGGEVQSMTRATSTWSLSSEWRSKNQHPDLDLIFHRSSK